MHAVQSFHREKKNTLKKSFKTPKDNDNNEHDECKLLTTTICIFATDKIRNYELT